MTLVSVLPKALDGIRPPRTSTMPMARPFSSMPTTSERRHYLQVPRSTLSLGRCPDGSRIKNPDAPAHGMVRGGPPMTLGNMRRRA
jgi:hypothetical protein